MEYYVGKWQDHKIVVENMELSERLLLDGEVAAETKSGLRFGSVLTAEIPGTNGLWVYVMLDISHACYCIVGKPLKAEYDKSAKTFSAEYDGHTIEAVNKLKAKLLIDGAETDKEAEGLRSFVILGSDADANGKRFMSIHDGVTNVFKAKCDIYAEAENVRLIRCEKVGGELMPVQGMDGSDGFLLGFVMGSAVN